MKTLLEIKQEQEVLRTEAGDIRHDKAQKRKYSQLIKRIKWLDRAIHYMETMPAPAYVTQSLSVLRQKKEVIDRRVYDEIIISQGGDPFNPETKKRIESKKREYGMQAINNQIKFLNYIYR